MAPRAAPAEPPATPRAGTVERQLAARLASADALAHEAEDALREERDEDAFGAAEACLRRDPTELRCQRAAAVALLRTDRRDAARSYVAACLARDHSDVQCLLADVQLALYDRDLTRAGIDLWRLSQLAPDSADMLVARAQLSDLQGDPVAAERAYRQACRAGQAYACIRLGGLLTSARP